ncbi:hypothetical protein TW95_gp0286 [Pandoravirus inopinatum]|uniref:Uncharacterized protein n=1 Tax=Pandoravirus inopinatum TaxID=1605721 RepID=A0A0B5J5R1_9VIRU|nr:hypothetical protein TW95_gp0286 [Pandoravirus inopinatum]AJF97020.1 hypothetical protein [Pandoravirus inopinatum]
MPTKRAPSARWLHARNGSGRPSACCRPFVAHTHTHTMRPDHLALKKWVAKIWGGGTKKEPGSMRGTARLRHLSGSCLSSLFSFLYFLFEDSLLYYGGHRHAAIRPASCSCRRRRVRLLEIGDARVSSLGNWAKACKASTVVTCRQ